MGSPQAISQWEDALSLNLTYVTENIIAMGFPVRTRYLPSYLNPTKPEGMKSFLNRVHEEKYRVYNLCEEAKYDVDEFYSTVDFGFIGVPSIPLILEFCKNVQAWLAEDPERVIAVHCDDGLGRTGLMIACYLLYSERCTSASQALQKFDWRRSPKGKGVVRPSQRRYVFYWESYLKVKPDQYQKFLLASIRIKNHNYREDQFPRACVTDIISGQTVYTNGEVDQNDILYSIPGIGLKGDTIINFVDVATLEILLSYSFNPAFLQKDQVSQDRIYKVRKSDLDGPHSDMKHRRFSPDFHIEIDMSILMTQLSQIPLEQRTSPEGSVNKSSVSFDTSKQEKPEVKTNLYDGLLTRDGLALQCSKCGKKSKDLILSKQGTHTCSNCDMKRKKTMFRRCEQCKRAVTVGAKVIEGHFWHTECFKCARCSVLLRDLDVAFIGGKLICSLCIAAADDDDDDDLKSSSEPVIPEDEKKSNSNMVIVVVSHSPDKPESEPLTMTRETTGVIERNRRVSSARLVNTVTADKKVTKLGAITEFNDKETSTQKEILENVIEDLQETDKVTVPSKVKEESTTNRKRALVRSQTANSSVKSRPKVNRLDTDAGDLNIQHQWQRSQVDPSTPRGLNIPRIKPASFDKSRSEISISPSLIPLQRKQSPSSEPVTPRSPNDEITITHGWTQPSSPNFSKPRFTLRLGKKDDQINDNEQLQSIQETDQKDLISSQRFRGSTHAPPPARPLPPVPSRSYATSQPIAVKPGIIPPRSKPLPRVPSDSTIIGITGKSKPSPPDKEFGEQASPNSSQSSSPYFDSKFINQNELAMSAPTLNPNPRMRAVTSPRQNRLKDIEEIELCLPDESNPDTDLSFLDPMVERGMRLGFYKTRRFASYKELVDILLMWVEDKFSKLHENDSEYITLHVIWNSKKFTHTPKKSLISQVIRLKAVMREIVYEPPDDFQIVIMQYEMKAFITTDEDLVANVLSQNSVTLTIYQKAQTLEKLTYSYQINQDIHRAIQHRIKIDTPIISYRTLCDLILSVFERKTQEKGI